MSDHKQNHENFKKKVAYLDSDDRKNALPPEDLLAMLSLENEKDACILDVGAGSGYFSLPAARLLPGTVFALDMDQRMLDIMAEKAKAEGLSNLKLIQGDIEKIPLESGSMDAVLASLILHEFSNPSIALTDIFRVMKPGAKLLCLEFEKDESIINGPPRISPEALKKELTAAGFEVKNIQPAGRDIRGSEMYLIVAVK